MHRVVGWRASPIQSVLQSVGPRTLAVVRQGIAERVENRSRRFRMRHVPHIALSHVRSARASEPFILLLRTGKL